MRRLSQVGEDEGQHLVEPGDGAPLLLDGPNLTTRPSRGKACLALDEALWTQFGVTRIPFHDAHQLFPFLAAGADAGVEDLALG